MSFFMKGKRRKAGGDERSTHQKTATSKEKKKSKYDEEIESDSDLERSDVEEKPKKGDELSEEEQETAQEKKLRLTKQYLAQLHDEEISKRDAQEIDRDVISDRLKSDILEQTGKVQKDIADRLKEPCVEDIRIFRGHQLSVTCVVISPDDKHIYSGSKDCSIIKWSVETGRKVHTIPGGRKGTEKVHVGHTTHVLCLAISSDNAFLASGDRSHIIHVWRPSDCTLLHTFRGHRDAVSGLSFRWDTHQLFSGSLDRSVRVWNLDEMAFVETLYGHQDEITDLDCLARDRAITSGGRDRTVRIWKVVEESQLVYNGHKGCIDCVALINEQSFVTGGDDNCLLLWTVSKKKAAHTRTKTHTGNGQSDNWISALASMKYTDLLASGSKDGHLKLWKCHNNMTQLDHLFSVPIVGFVNSLKFSSDGQFLVAGIGQEHKKGRWWRLKTARNSICVIKLTYN